MSAGAATLVEVHAPGCAECLGTFTCPGCQRTCGLCIGAHDDMPELCDDCWKHVTDVREEYER